jgi:CRISPR-associated protein Cst2
MTVKISSLAISGLLTLEMHSLNNEGSEGNYLETRQVQVVDKSGQIHSVNAVSGDMLKHMQAEHLYQIAVEADLPLCGACKHFDANRIVADQDFASSFEEGAADNDILTKAIQTCILDDCEGILITSAIGGKKRAIGRKSLVEFGWLVGRPEETVTESYFHVKYAPEGRGKGAGDATGAGNVGQNIFHRPASSGRYAVVLNVDLYRLGRNDINFTYAMSQDERLDRAQALLTSILHTFLKPTGAHRNTQNPHVLAFEGCVALSSGSVPAPVASALDVSYLSEIETIARSLNELTPDVVSLHPFASPGGFAEVMTAIIRESEL